MTGWVAGPLRTISLALASCFYLTYIPAYVVKNKRLTGAGIIGTAWGLLFIHWLPTEPVREIAVWVGVLALAVVISDLAEDALASHDDPRIVIDEFVGVWTTLLFLPRTLSVFVLGFVMFRVLDVLKPGWIRQSGGLPGGWGIVMDDVLAGFVANVVLQIINRVHPF